MSPGSEETSEQVFEGSSDSHELGREEFVTSPLIEELKDLHVAANDFIDRFNHGVTDLKNTVSGLLTEADLKKAQNLARPWGVSPALPLGYMIARDGLEVNGEPLSSQAIEVMKNIAQDPHRKNLHEQLKKLSSLQERTDVLQVYKATAEAFAQAVTEKRLSLDTIDFSSGESSKTKFKKDLRWYSSGELVKNAEALAIDMAAIAGSAIYQEAKVQMDAVVEKHAGEVLPVEPEPEKKVNHVKRNPLVVPHIDLRGVTPIQLARVAVGTLVVGFLGLEVSGVGASPADRFIIPVIEKSEIPLTSSSAESKVAAPIIVNEVTPEFQSGLPISEVLKNAVNPGTVVQLDRSEVKTLDKKGVTDALNQNPLFGIYDGYYKKADADWKKTHASDPNSFTTEEDAAQEFGADGFLSVVIGARGSVDGTYLTILDPENPTIYSAILPLKDANGNEALPLQILHVNGKILFGVSADGKVVNGILYQDPSTHKLTMADVSQADTVANGVQLLSYFIPESSAGGTNNLDSVTGYTAKLTLTDKRVFTVKSWDVKDLNKAYSQISAAELFAPDTGLTLANIEFLVAGDGGDKYVAVAHDPKLREIGYNDSLISYDEGMGVVLVNGKDLMPGSTKTFADGLGLSADAADHFLLLTYGTADGVAHQLLDLTNGEISFHSMPDGVNVVFSANSVSAGTGAGSVDNGSAADASTTDKFASMNLKESFTATNASLVVGGTRTSDGVYSFDGSLVAQMKYADVNDALTKMTSNQSKYEAKLGIKLTPAFNGYKNDAVIGFKGSDGSFVDPDGVRIAPPDGGFVVVPQHVDTLVNVVTGLPTKGFVGVAYNADGFRAAVRVMDKNGNVTWVAAPSDIPLRANSPEDVKRIQTIIDSQVKSTNTYNNYMNGGSKRLESGTFTRVIGGKTVTFNYNMYGATRLEDVNGIGESSPIAGFEKVVDDSTFTAVNDQLASQGQGGFGQWSANVANNAGLFSFGQYPPDKRTDVPYQQAVVPDNSNLYNSILNLSGNGSPVIIDLFYDRQDTSAEAKSANALPWSKTSNFLRSGSAVITDAKGQQHLVVFLQRTGGTDVIIKKRTLKDFLPIASFTSGGGPAWLFDKAIDHAFSVYSQESDQQDFGGKHAVWTGQPLDLTEYKKWFGTKQPNDKLGMYLSSTGS